MPKLIVHTWLQFHDHLISFLEVGQNNSDFEPAAMFVSPHFITFTVLVT